MGSTPKDPYLRQINSQILFHLYSQTLQVCNDHKFYSIDMDTVCNDPWGEIKIDLSGNTYTEI